jgi:two-component system, LytTR family, sensor kinase
MKTLNIENVLDQRRVVTHVWIVVLSILTVSLYIYLSGGEKSTGSWIIAIITGTLQIELFLFLAHLIFRNLDPGNNPVEITKRVISRFMFFLLLCLLSAFIIAIGQEYINQIIKGGDLSGVLSNFFRYSFTIWFKSTFSGLVVGTLIFMVVLWQDALKREQRLREENLIFQNETLKNQVNPHFLFNSLNTLSSLIDYRPEISGMFISKLSAIYRYILDNSHRDKVPLKSELAFVSDYFDLHKIRDEEKIELIMMAEDDGQFWILPVSLQILIENAIKHNKATREQPLRISIFTESSYIVVSNNLQRMAVQLKSTKIGLKNLRERVRLITGRELVIEESIDEFKVKVPLMK